MADIELVIKIPEHDKNVIKRFVQGDGCEDFPPSIIEDLIRAVYFATPLPKGHGRLIEADENLYQEIRKWVGVGVAFDIIENAPTIIKADKGDKE